MSIRYFTPILILLVLVSCQDKPQKQAHKKNAVPKVVQTEPEYKYGFRMDRFIFERDTVNSGESFGFIMHSNGLSRGEIFKTVQAVKDTFNVKYLRAGQPYTLVKNQDTAESVRAFIYNKDRIHYTVIEYGDSIKAYHKKKPVSLKHRTASGVISSSLSQAMAREGLSISLSRALINLYRWKVDFFHLRDGDKFKVIYNEKYIEDSVYAGLANIEAAVFKHRGEEFFAFRYGVDSTDKFSKYYDKEGESLQSFFLKAPLDYTAITSHYQKRRYHPVLHRWMSHKGTDYAAPRGTPIWTTADGVVIESGYTSGNGNYVKVRHNEKYTTQYLHMSERNVSVGEYVNQGDVIGFVGATGLATGPHVCYRFWVNGRQVDPFEQDLPSAKPLPDSLKQEYFKHIHPMIEELENIPYKKLKSS